MHQSLPIQKGSTKTPGANGNRWNQQIHMLPRLATNSKMNNDIDVLFWTVKLHPPWPPQFQPRATRDLEEPSQGEGLHLLHQWSKNIKKKHPNFAPPTYKHKNNAHMTLISLSLSATPQVSFCAVSTRERGRWRIIPGNRQTHNSDDINPFLWWTKS